MHIPSDSKFANCHRCANKDNFPFCMKACNLFHTRRPRRGHRVEHKELTPFAKWMHICLMPVYLQYTFNKALTKDMSFCRKVQFRPGLTAIILAEIAVFGGVGVTLWGMGKVLAKVIRQFQRPQYYPQERARRQRLAKDRRRIRKRYTLNRAPMGEELLAQWAKVRKNPKEMIRFGSMLCDIEAYVDNSLIRNQYGEIIGRQSGIKGWLAINCPDLHCRYSTIMRYKATAEKFRQAFDLKDPYPAAMLLDDSDSANTASEITVRNSIVNGEVGEVANEENGNEITVRNEIGAEGVRKSGMRKSGRWIEEKREGARRMLDECRMSERGLLAGIGAMINPDAVPAEVERQERLRQGLPEKDGILRRFTKVMA